MILSYFRGRKKNFTLLEVVIALVIVAAAAPLLFGVPFRLAKRRLDLLFETELQRVASVEWGKWKMRVHAEEIFDIETMKKNPLFTEEKTCSIVLGDGIHRDYRVVKKILSMKQKKTQAETIASLAKVRFSFIPSKGKEKLCFDYFLCMEEPSKESL